MADKLLLLAAASATSAAGMSCRTIKSPSVLYRISDHEWRAKFRSLDVPQSAAGVDCHRGVSRLRLRSAAAFAQAERGNDHVHFVSRRRTDADAEDADTAADYIESYRR
jgi:hypothetical protein